MSEYAISVVTWNRSDLAKRVLEAIEATCPEPHLVLVTDNGSTDGTALMLQEAEARGLIDYLYLLPENLGAPAARNVHWGLTAGHPTVKLDDKVLPLASGWLTALAELSQATHSILGPAYSEGVRPLQNFAPCLPYVQWDADSEIGGPYTYLPAEVRDLLGGWDVLTKPDGATCKYGWDDVLYVQRARLLGWRYGFCFRFPFENLAWAGPGARLKAMEYHPEYLERLREYRDAERDLKIETEESESA